MESGIDDGYRVEVRFHPKLGYPTDFYMDWKRRLLEEEGGYIVGALHLN